MVEIILKALSEILDDESIENLRKGIVFYESDPSLGISFFLKSIATNSEDCSVENLRKALSLYETEPFESINFFLKAVSRDTEDFSAIENLRKGILIFNDDSLGAIEFLLKVNGESFDNLRKGILLLKDNPLGAIDFLLKSLRDNNEDENIDNLRKGILIFKDDPFGGLDFLLKTIVNDEGIGEITSNLRKGIVLYKESPMEALDFLLKALTHGCDLELVDHLRKGILEYKNDPMQSLNSLLKVVEKRTRSTLVGDLRKTIISNPEVNWGDAFSVGQVKSKIWALKELEKLAITNHLAYIYGGWFGVLPFIASLRGIKISQLIRSFDIDPDCRILAEALNKTAVLDNWSLKGETIDIREIEYPHKYHLTRASGSQVEVIEEPDLIFNTSCEHMDSSWLNQLKEGMLVVIQSNNFTSQPEHINCVASLDEFKSKYPLKEVLFEGSLDLDQYTRFMLIGRI